MLLHALGISMWLAPDLFRVLKGGGYHKARLRAGIVIWCSAMGTVMGLVATNAMDARTHCEADGGGSMRILYGLINWLSLVMACLAIVSGQMCLVNMARAKAQPVVDDSTRYANEKAFVKWWRRTRRNIRN